MNETKKAFDKIKEKLALHRENKQKVLDERYEDLPESDETEQERNQRIMADPTAWTSR